MLSTQPDSTLPIEFHVGESCVDCIIKNLPLAAGEYSLGAALTVPEVEYLWRRQQLCVLTVFPNDVYGSGLAPSASRALVAVPHEWRVVQ
jgi:hypothetical protein